VISFGLNSWGISILQHVEITFTCLSQILCPEGLTGRIVHQSAFITQSADHLVDTDILNNDHGAKTRTLNCSWRTLIFQHQGVPSNSTTTKARQVNSPKSRDTKPKFSPPWNSESADLSHFRRQRPPYVRGETLWVSKKGIEPSALPPGPGTMLPLIISRHAPHSSWMRSSVPSSDTSPERPVARVLDPSRFAVYPSSHPF